MRDSSRTLTGRRLRDQPVGLAKVGAVDGVAHRARVGKVRLLDAQGQVLAQRLPRRVVEGVLLFAHHQLGNGHQLVDREVGELDVVRDARAQPGVGVKEGLHTVSVSSEDHHEVAALIFHRLQQHLDGLLTVVAFVLGADRGSRPRR